jgi:hypothetical protein
MRKIFLSLILSLSFGAYSQNSICFGYDAAGNRTNRTICLKSSETVADTSSAIQPIKDQLGEFEINLFPNPTLGLINVTISGVSEPVGYLLLSDLNGKILFKQESLQPTNRFDLSSFPKGIYILRIQATEKESVWKVIKE